MKTVGKIEFSEEKFSSQCSTGHVEGSSDHPNKKISLKFQNNSHR